MADQPLDLAGIKERCEMALHGPFSRRRRFEYQVVRTDLPACVAEIERRGLLIKAQTDEIVKLRNLAAAMLENQEAARDNLQAHLQEVEWIETPASAG